MTRSAEGYGRKERAMDKANRKNRGWSSKESWTYELNRRSLSYVQLESTLGLSEDDCVPARGQHDSADSAWEDQPLENLNNNCFPVVQCPHSLPCLVALMQNGKEQAPNNIQSLSAAVTANQERALAAETCLHHLEWSLESWNNKLLFLVQCILSLPCLVILLQNGKEQARKNIESLLAVVTANQERALAAERRTTLTQRSEA
jgi:hypothetical protein